MIKSNYYIQIHIRLYALTKFQINYGVVFLLYTQSMHMHSF